MEKKRDPARSNRIMSDEKCEPLLVSISRASSLMRLLLHHVLPFHTTAAAFTHKRRSNNDDVRKRNKLEIAKRTTAAAYC